jgi:hypothetical protein
MASRHSLLANIGRTIMVSSVRIDGSLAARRYLTLAFQSHARRDEVGAESPFTVDVEVDEQTLAPTVDGARSIDEIDGWLRSQRSVVSVRLADYVLESNPVQRELFVEFRLQDGSTLTKIVNIFDLGQGKFQLHELRDR